MSDPGPIRFPPKSKPPVTLALPRRRSPTRSPFERSEKSTATQQSIHEVVSTRAPFMGGASADSAKVNEWDAAVKKLELALAEREREVTEERLRLADLKRDLEEAEQLLIARERVAKAVTKPAVVRMEGTAEEKAALEQLRAELERQEATLEEAKQAARDREVFLDESETKLFEKVQAQQEKEIELDQREEDLRARERRVREREAAVDPAAAAKLKDDDERAKKRDEFSE